MGLSLEQAKEKIKSPPNRGLISNACDYEQWVRLHSGYNDDLSRNFGYKNLANKISSLIGDPKKVDTVMSFITTPLTTKKLVGKIKRSHRKIFDGKNPIYDIVFTNDKKQEAFEYLENLGFDEFIDSIFQDFYEYPCSFYAVDMPVISEETEPYPVKIPCNSVWGAEYKGDNLLYVIFESGEFVMVYCDEYYRVFVKNDAGEYVLAFDEAPHDLGFCPVFQLSIPVNNTNAFKRWCPLSDYLNDMDYIVSYEAMLKVYEAYGPFPILSVYESDCDYRQFNGKVQEGEDLIPNAIVCDGGFLKDEHTGHYNRNQNNELEKCPACKERYFMGPASVIRVPQPSADAVGKDTRLDSPQIKTIDVAGLEYAYDKVKERKSILIEDVVGKVDLPDNKSINETQIEAAFQNQIDTLLGIKTPIERMKIKLGSTILTLRYDDSFEKMEFSLGTDFYIIGADGLIGIYDNLRINKSSESVLNFVYEEYLMSKYRNNPAKLHEAYTWFKIDPWPHYDFASLKELIPLGIYSEKDLKLKANLASSINRFKSENNVLIFGEFLPEEERIERIKYKLISYV